MELSFLDKPGAKRCIIQKYFMILIAYRERWSRPNTSNILLGAWITEFPSCITKNTECHQQRIPEPLYSPSYLSVLPWSLCTTQISNTLFLQNLDCSGFRIKQKDWVSILLDGSDLWEQYFHPVLCYAFLRPLRCTVRSRRTIELFMKGLIFDVLSQIPLQVACQERPTVTHTVLILWQ